VNSLMNQSISITYKYVSSWEAISSQGLCSMESVSRCSALMDNV
jgi:hypothetical protein